MEQKINIAELLKEAPFKTLLYSPAYGRVALLRVTSTNGILVRTNHLSEVCFYEDGRLSEDEGSRCMLFPDEKCTWEDFKPSWKPEHKVFEAFDKVLVATYYKAEDKEIWTASLYSHYDGEFHRTVNGDGYTDDTIHPYIGNEGLLGKEVEK